MYCPNCGNKSGVLETARDSNAVYRKRKCKSCDFIFYSMEDLVPYKKDLAMKLAFCEKWRGENKNEQR